MSLPEFDKKPRRMTSPTQNEAKYLIGEEGTEVIMETEPDRIAYFAREATWGDIMREPTADELADTLAEVAAGKTLSAALKGGVAFRIRSSRVTMDQALRLAEGSGGAGSGAGAQTTRDNDMRDWNQIIPQTIHQLGYNGDGDLHDKVLKYIEDTHQLYGELVDAGVPPQDARYIALPQGFQTQWLHVMSYGNIVKMCEHRLCNGLVQWEVNYLTRMMRDLVVERSPWMAPALRSACEKRGECVSHTMLFPPCGAFVGESSYPSEQEVRLEISRFDPDKHLYPSEQNSAMAYAMWDAERSRLERQYPNTIFTMAGPPVSLFGEEYH